MANSNPRRLEIPATGEKHWSNWSLPKNGLQCRIKPAVKKYKPGKPLTVAVEFRNVSSESILLLDFLDNPPLWSTSASYLRGMIMGFNGQEPHAYHMLTSDIVTYVNMKPGESYSLLQSHNGSTELRAQDSLKMVYDTEVAEHYWKGDYWKGRIESETITIF